MTERTVLITGATGAIGPALVTKLIQTGYHVRTLGRHSAPSVGNYAMHISGSITDIETVIRAMSGIDIVFHLAALLHIENPIPELEAEYQHVNVEGTRLLTEQAAQSGVQRFVYFSTVKVYGIHQRQPVTEEYPLQPKTMYARTKYEGELAARSESGLETSILRLSPVYGPRVKGSWARMIRSIERNRFMPIGSLRNVHSLTHVDDIARAAVLVAENSQAANQVYNLVGHESPTLHQILTAIYASYGNQIPPIHIPASVAYAGAFTAEKILETMGKRSSLPVDALRQLLEDEAYSGAKLRQLGFAPEVSINEGWGIYD